MLIRRGILVLVILGLFLPFLPLLVWSVAESWYFPDLIPTRWSSQNWNSILSASLQVGQGLSQSLGIASGATALALIVGLPAGRALGTLDFPGKSWIRLFLILPILVSPLATVMGIQFVLIRLKLLGTLVGVLWVHLIPTIPYMVLVLSSVFANFDQGYEVQARVLGASPWQTLTQVTLPLIAPGIAVSALFAFLISWNDFLLTFFVGAGQVFTLPMVLFTLLQGGNNGLIASVAITSLLPAFLFLLVTSRILVEDTDALGGLGQL